MAEMVLISVLMPVFNGEKYIAQAVESILDQTFTDFELILIDDGSRDGTLPILQSFAARDARIRLVSRENRGLVVSLNEMLQMAQGEFIARMDADDIALPDRFAWQVQFLREHPETVCLGGAFQLIDEADRLLATLSPPSSNDDIQQSILAGHGAICHPTAMMRRDALIKVGGYDAAYYPAEDVNLWLRLGEVGELANLESPVLKYRLHGNSISEQAGNKQREATRRACEAAWQRRNIEGVFMAGGAWRPGTDAASRHDYMIKYGWWAWSSRQRKTAAIYGCKAIRVRPLSMAGWRLLLVALIKPLSSVGRG
ncbi:MAG TPA: glycosyltransferase [Parasulfuritortus sp.]